MEKMNLKEDINYNIQAFDQQFTQCNSFDLVKRIILVGNRKSCFYFIDGFCKDEVMQKILERFMDIEEKDMPKTMNEFEKIHASYVEVSMETKLQTIIENLLAGVIVFFIDGYDEALLLDARTYPARSISEPDKDKAIRGSKDGFVETIVWNTALIRRRIRSTQLCMEMLNVGSSSKTDVVLCYMNDRVDHKFLSQLKTKINGIRVDALSMNQESIAECLYAGKWFNPFPKFKYTERPDTAASEILEGNIIILVDNSPSAMITPTTIFDITQEADDFYFPPITGTYLRLSRLLIAIFTYLITPTFLLFINSPELLPDVFSFIAVKETIYIPVIVQFLLLELAIDGLRLASVNTPNMLSTPLSIMAALILGELTISSGWLNSEVLLYMAFVAIGSYTQPSFELGYAIKFFRILGLICTQLFGIVGYIGSILFFIISLLCNKTVSNTNYLFPLIPFQGEKLIKTLFRLRINSNKKAKKE